MGLTVVMMCSASLDGKLTPVSESSSRPFLDHVPEHYHEQLMDLREEVDAVAVGNRTILHDDSSLLPPSGEDRLRVVIDPEGILDATYSVLSDESPTLIAVTDTTSDAYVETVEKNARKQTVSIGTDTPDLGKLADALTERGVDDLLLEGGGRLIYYFLEAQLIDECRILYLPFFVGDEDAVTAAHGPESFFPSIRLDVTRRDEVGDYTMIEGNVRYED